MRNVPYLRMSGRWLEEHGFAIGSGVQVLVEQGRVTLISEAWKLRVAGCELPGQLRLDEEARATRNPQR